ncbi:MAG TPA: spore maturation protein [Tenericutes bacterium]|jgi:spore maturation protein B|nr:spore maturation protein [Mycoplasmatota bacterium]
MNLLSISSLIIPTIVLLVIFYGYFKKIDIFDIFIEGVKEGFQITKGIFSNILAMVFAINIFLKSNFINVLNFFLKPLFNILKVPLEIIPLVILKPLSGSSSLAILNNIFSSYSPDSFLGRLASVVYGATDTTLYIITLYFSVIGIKKIKYALWVGLLADFVGIVASIIIVSSIF